MHQHFHLPRLEGRCKATWKRKLVGLQDLCFDNNPQWEPPLEVSSDSGNIDIRLPGKGNSDSHRARPVHLIISMIMWIRTSRLSIKNSVFTCGGGLGGSGVSGAGFGVRSLEFRNVHRFRGGLVFQAHRLLCHSTLGFRVIKKKKKVRGLQVHGGWGVGM